ncbi:MAG: formylglycine-generating enzyme family protein, partial [Planctomicrobium sp.]|nr:formylglycine-generating enzyme family protein [Planctomicrobium sp.]
GDFPATVTIGSLDGSEAERPPYQAQLKKEFSIAKYEVYQSLYTEVMGNNPSRWHGPRNSAEKMTYGEAEEFCRRITNRLRKEKLITGNQLIRLPNEVEWEYCTRAGTTTPYSFGKSATAPTDQGNKASVLDPYGWHTGNAAGNDPAVGVLKPNPWGLYDVHGYLSEFCQGDWKENYSSQSKVNEKSVAIRGGSWKDRYPLLTSSSRRPFPKTDRDDAVGFRCVIVEE